MFFSITFWGARGREFEPRHSDQEKRGNHQFTDDFHGFCLDILHFVRWNYFVIRVDHTVDHISGKYFVRLPVTEYDAPAGISLFSAG